MGRGDGDWTDPPGRSFAEDCPSDRRRFGPAAGGDEIVRDMVALIDETLSRPSERAKLRNLIEGHRDYAWGFRICWEAESTEQR